MYILRSFYSFIYKKGLGQDLARGFDAVKVRKKEREYLTPEEMDRVLAAMDNPLMAILLSSCTIQELGRESASTFT